VRNVTVKQARSHKRYIHTRNGKNQRYIHKQKQQQRKQSTMKTFTAHRVVLLWSLLASAWMSAATFPKPVRCGRGRKSVSNRANTTSSRSSCFQKTPSAIPFYYTFVLACCGRCLYALFIDPRHGPLAPRSCFANINLSMYLTPSIDLSMFYLFALISCRSLPSSFFPPSVAWRFAAAPHPSSRPPD
jgi:hypothetical protein